ncbi:MAG: hypothetical protein RLZZ77_399 [Bacteroidota bacterium]|jgi:uncharacterized membrane protein YfcA
MTALLFFFAALIAEILGTIGGFGSSLFFVPVASYFFDFETVLGITALFHVSSNLVKIALFRHGFDKRLFLLVGIPSVIGVVIGAYLSALAPSFWLEWTMAIFLILFSAFLLLWQKLKVSDKPSISISSGLVSGFLAGLVGTGGAVRGIALSAFRLRMEVFIATSAFIDLLVDLSRSVVYYNNGYIHQAQWKWVFGLIGVSILGTWIGKRILSEISEERFRVIVLYLIAGVGVATLIRLV